MKMFRWSGLIGFMVFTGLLALIGFFFLDGWLKSALESAGMKLNGAEVNVAKVDFTLSPLGFNLEGIEIANPDKLTHDALVLSRVKVEINFLQLFLGNVRINDLVVSDVQTDVLRRIPAELAPVTVANVPAGAEQSVVVAATQDKAQAIGKLLPSPADLVSEQTRSTRDAVAQAQSTIDSGRSTVEASVSDLPGDAALRDYKQRIAALKGMPLDSLANVQQSQSLVSALGRDIAQDKIRIETVKRSMNGAVNDSKQALDAILAGPDADWAQLKADYPLNKDSAYQIAELLLGEAFFAKINQAQYWYAKAKPWIARLQSEAEPGAAATDRLVGQVVRFEHPDPTARFQMDQSLLSFVADQRPWQLTVGDLASGRTNATKPVHIQLRRGDVSGASLLVNGQLDLIDDQRVDTFDLQGEGIDFAARQINMAGTNLSWTPQPANVSGQLKAVDGRLSGVVSILFPSNRFSVVDGGQTAKYLQTALKTVDEFRVDIEVSGTLKRPGFAVGSDLDKQLSAALRDVAQAEYEAWLAAMQVALDAEIARLRQPADAAFSQLSGKRDAVEQQIQKFEQEVEAEIRSLEEKLANERKRFERAANEALNAAKDKAQAKMDAAQAKLQAELEVNKAKAQAEVDAAKRAADAEKSRAEAAAQKAAEDKLKAEANKLTDKIKF
ncbi:TIGR03545 family protein [Reinekea sp.]|uniref:TIGR03545 family protein n=1 Tax=Reinekea sp. TaxID=1970455 RepID=UPI002A7F8315|nr:TIGR03545 family protein [Reinekea sp.]